MSGFGSVADDALRCALPSISCANTRGNREPSSPVREQERCCEEPSRVHDVSCVDATLHLALHGETSWVGGGRQDDKLAKQKAKGKGEEAKSTKQVAEEGDVVVACGNVIFRSMIGQPRNRENTANENVTQQLYCN